MDRGRMLISRKVGNEINNAYESLGQISIRSCNNVTIHVARRLDVVNCVYAVKGFGLDYERARTRVTLR